MHPHNVVLILQGTIMVSKLMNFVFSVWKN